MGGVGGGEGQRSGAGGDTLRVGSEGGKLRHWLAGRQVRHWDVLEVRLADGTWLRGRYEWTGRPDDDPALIVELAGGGEAWRREAQFLLPIGAELRWADTQSEAVVDGGKGDVASTATGEATTADELKPAAPERPARKKPPTSTRSRKVIDVRDEPEGGGEPAGGGSAPQNSEATPPLF